MGNDYQVPIYYQDPAGLPQDQIRAALQAVQALYGPIRLNVQPWPMSGPIPDPLYKMLIFSHRPTGAIGEAGGETLPGNQRAYIFTDQLEGYGDQRALALRYAIAHELGHTLGLGHTTSGVMAPNFTTESLERDVHPLSGRQIRRIEKTLDTLQKAAALRRARGR